MSIQISGYLYDGQVAQPKAATLVVNDTEVFFLNSEKKYFLTDLKIHRRLGDVPRVFEIHGLRFETVEFEKVETLDKLLGKSEFIYRAERNFKLAALVSIGFIVTIFLLYKIVIPMSAKKIAAHAPDNIKDMMSAPAEKYLGYLDEAKDLKALDEDELEIFDQAIADLQKAFPDHKIIAKIIYLDTANAFILANGKIFVTSKLIKLARSSDELLGVLLHEMGHFHHNHVIEGLIESSAISALIIFITGGTEWTNVPIVMLSNVYSRESEAQADDFAISMMQKLEKNPSNMADLFLRMDASDKTGAMLPSFLSTHPSMKNRIEKIEAKAANE